MNESTFERLYRELTPGLYRLAQGMLRNAADAQDAVQQAAVKAWKAGDRIRPGGERAYITRIVVNECRNIQRERMRMTPVDSVPEKASPEGNDDLKRAIDALPEALRLPLLLKYMEGYSEREAAAILEISVPALKSRLFKARRQLARELGEEVELV